MDSHPLRKPTRIPGFDYATAGTYFVTICLNDRSIHRFGEIESGELALNEAGELISRLWLENIERFPGTTPDEWVVMPDHVHGILHLGTDSSIPTVPLTDMVGTFKSISTLEYGRRVREASFLPFEKTLWQRSFYDRILVTPAALEAARAYIESNPARWLDPRKGKRGHGTDLR